MTETQRRMPAPDDELGPAQRHDVFVSYSRADRDVVVRLVAGLDARGLRPWVDLESIPPTAEWMSEIQAAIEAADGFLVVVSPDLARSQVCAEELDQAVAAGKRIVPIQVRSTDPGTVPATLAALNWIDATSGTLDAPLEAAVEALRTDLDHVKAHTRLLVRASEWERKHEAKASLLRGAEIAEAEQVVASAADPRATPGQARFVQASRAAATRRQRGLIGAVATALVVSLGLSAIALVQRGEAVESQQRAERQTQIANSRALASEALLQMDERLDVGMLLSLEAYRTAPTPQAMDALHVASQRSAWIERTLHDHGAGINVLALAPSGAVLAEGDTEGLVLLRDPESGELLGDPLEADSGAVNAMAFAPSSDALATGGSDGNVIVWDVDDGRQESSFEVGRSEVTSVTFADEGGTLIAAASDGKLYRWDLGSGEPIGQPIAVSGRFASALVVDPGTGDVVVGSDEGSVTVMDVRTGRELRSLSTAAEEVWGLAIDPGAERLAVATKARRTQAATGEVEVFDLGTGRKVLTLRGHTDEVYSVAFSPDGGSIASGSADGTVRTWSVATGEPIGEALAAHGDWVNGVAYSVDGGSLFSGGSDGTVVDWDVEQRLFGLGGGVNEVVFSTDGRSMVTTEPIHYATDGSVAPGGLVAWDTSTLERTATRTRAGSYGITLSPDGRNIVGTEVVDPEAFQSRIVFLDVDTLEEVDEIEGPGDFLSGVGVGPNGVPVVAGGGLGKVYAWDQPDREPGRRGGHEGFVYAVEYSPDRTVLATGGFDGTVVLRDPSDGRVVGEPLLVDQGSIYALAFDATGDRLAVGDVKGRVSVWDRRTSEPLLDLELDDGALSIAFSPDGTILAVGSTAGDVQLFTAATGERIGEPLAGQRDWVNSVAFSPDGDQLAAASDDGSILLLGSVLWSDDIDLLSQHLCAAAGRNLTDQEWDDLIGFAPYHQTCQGQT